MNEETFEPHVHLNDDGAPSAFSGTPFFEGWDETESEFRQLQDEDIEYLSLCVRRDGKEPQIARLPIDSETFEDLTTLEEEFENPGDRILAMLRWLRSSSIKHIEREGATAFRVKVYGPKGITCIKRLSWSVSFSSTTPSLDSEPENNEPQQPPPTGNEEVGKLLEAKAMREVSSLHIDFSDHLLGAGKQMSAMQAEASKDIFAMLREQVKELRDQIRSKDKTIEKLTGAVLTSRVEAVEREETRLLEERKNVQGNETLKFGMKLIQETMEKSFIGSNVPEPLRKLLTEKVVSNPQLMNLMADPDLIEILSDPDKTQAFVGVLKQIAPQMRGQQAQGQTPPQSPG